VLNPGSTGNDDDDDDPLVELHLLIPGTWKKTLSLCFLVCKWVQSVKS